MRVDDVHTLADDYVLGLLEQADEMAVEAELPHNIDLQRAVASARDRFLPLDMTVTPVAVSATLWAQIEPRLGGEQATVADGTRATSGAQASPIGHQTANDNAATRWRRAAFGGMAATLLLAAGLGFSLTRTPEPVVVAVLVNENGTAQAVVEDFGSNRAVVRLLEDLAVPAGRTMQVWTLPSREMGPVSLGLLDEARSARLNPPSLPRPQNAQLYEITLEPEGGSPTGRPTGPILAKGLARLPR
ncbi:anti-sigma-K factor RskA [Neorhizobium galegae]|uniref:anti-sigma factor n=1 Tax=Neorhizobium galegae TaxID=399 RepID=UPI001AE8B721|nr:anti-sigma factor [Neorhizobium galegae]MBP2548138.1 anti-sigma-K factor RskA [Neorhizobium galegae]